VINCLHISPVFGVLHFSQKIKTPSHDHFNATSDLFALNMA